MRTIIVTGVSRSGSTFMGDLLSRADNALARHEHIGGRDFYCVSAYAPDHPFIVHDIDRGLSSLKAEAQATGRAVAVDVNSNLGLAVATVRAVSPQTRIFHLVRDGRAVIASQWRRKMYTRYAKGVDVRPSDLESLAAFEGYDRFEKLCWQWSHIVTTLLDQGVPLIRLEEIVGDYDRLEEAFLLPAGVELLRSVWEERRHARVNESRLKWRDLLRGRPTRLDWTKAREARFQDLCGRAMARLGYA